MKEILHYMNRKPQQDTSQGTTIKHQNMLDKKQYVWKETKGRVR